MTGDSSRERAGAEHVAGVMTSYPMARLTTVRTGGIADYFARAGTEERLLELLRWADAEGIRVGVVGSGSNLLVADDGFRGLAMKLEGELASREKAHAAELAELRETAERDVSAAEVQRERALRRICISRCERLEVRTGRSAR